MALDVLGRNPRSVLIQVEGTGNATKQLRTRVMDTAGFCVDKVRAGTRTVNKRRNEPIAEPETKPYNGTPDEQDEIHGNEW